MAEYLELWGVNDPNISAQLALAYKLDLFEREAGLEVTCRFIELGTTMAEDILKAVPLPFAFTQTPMTALLLHEQGVSTKIVAPLADIAGAQQVIVRPSGDDILPPQKLAEKRIGIVEGAAVFLALRNMAQACRLDLDAIHLINMSPQEQLNAFDERRIDGIASWEPWTSKARLLGGDFYFSGVHSHVPGYEGETNWLINQSCLIVPDEYLEAYPEKVSAILAVLQKTTELITNHRSEILDPLAEVFGMSHIDLIAAMGQNLYSLELSDTFRTGILNFMDFLYETGQISKRFPEKRLYDTHVLETLSL